jgi:hypothetical protein
MIAEKIHAIWSRELKLDEFSDTDDFFQYRVEYGIDVTQGRNVSCDRVRTWVRPRSRPAL